MIFFNRLFRFSAYDIVFVLIALAIMTVMAHAADGTAPETVAQAAGETTKVTLAWGAVINQAAATIASLALAAVVWLSRQLPANLAAVFANSRVQLLVDNAINYAINAVAGAVKDKTLTVDVGNQVLAQALQYAVDNAPAYLLAWAGGKTGLAAKILAKLNIAPEADASAVPGIVASTQPSGS